jgi:hypothetical protein
MELVSLLICLVVVDEIIPNLINFLKVLTWFFRSKCMSESLTPLNKTLVELLLKATIMDLKVDKYKVAESLLVNLF